MSTPNKKISNAELLDRLKAGFGYKTDVEVAGFLGLNKDTVSQIRQGLQGLSIGQRFKIMDRLSNIQIRNLLEKIAPDHLSQEIHRLSLRGAERLAFEETEAGKPKEIDVKLIDLFKSYGQELDIFHTDREMADFLGLKRATISSVRTGKTRLGPLPRLRMLKIILSNADTEQIEQGVQSNEYLFGLIEDHINLQATQQGSQ